MVLTIQSATAQYPGFYYGRAVELLAQNGASLEHVQLCPQSPQRMTEEVLAELQETYPDTRFRLHANVPLAGGRSYFTATEANLPEALPVFQEWARLNQQAGAEVYSLHANSVRFGRPTDLGKFVDGVHFLEDIFEMPVAVEGLYPDAKKLNFIASWEEYRWLLESGLAYALDLSHLNIVKTKEHLLPLGLVQDLLAHPNCREVHISGNNGRQDNHRICQAEEWWSSLLSHTNPQAVIFSEEDRTRP